MSGIKKIRLGSAPDCDVVMGKPGVEPHHATITFDGRKLMLQDAGTASGTFLNGQRIQALQVRPGDILGLGSHVFKLTDAMLAPFGPLPGTQRMSAVPPTAAPPATPPKRGAGRQVKRTMMQSAEELGVSASDPQAVVRSGEQAAKPSPPSSNRQVKRTMMQSADMLQQAIPGGKSTAPMDVGGAKRTMMQSMDDFDMSAATDFQVVVIPPGSVSISIGYAADNDVVIPVPQVAAYHCRLWKGGGKLILDDMGSAQGTFVEGERIDRIYVEPTHRIELGTYRLLLTDSVLAHFNAKQPDALVPRGGKTTFKVGRDDEPGVNDVVIDAPMVSNEHCELRYNGSGWVVKDHGSTNGTYVNTRQSRITEATITAADVLYFGTYRFPVSRLSDYLTDESGLKAGELAMPTGKDVMIVGRSDECDITIDAPQVSRKHAKLTKRADGLYIVDLGSANGTFVGSQEAKKPIKITARDVVGLGSYSVRFDLEHGTVASSYQGDIMLQAKNVTIKVNRGKKTILHDVSFTVYPTEFVGLMGPSGAGKTTLMMALNGYLPPSQGKSLINGTDLYSNYDAYRGNIGYVPQDDIIHSELTVWEALYYTARLRLPPDTTRKEIKKIIEDVLERLEISQTKDVLIGSPAKKGISGGQRKRVNLAQELITQPSLLFLDEPTSGLASEDTINVMALLRKLADGGRTILLTIHQPSLEAYRKMDNIVYLADGHLVYYGPTYPDSITYFNPTAKGGTPEGDLLLSDPGNALKPLAEDKRQGRNMSERAAQYLQSEHYKEYVQRRQAAGTESVSLTAGSKKKTSRRFGLGQWWVLTRRYFTIKRKDLAGTLILFMQAPIIAAIIAGVFHGKTDDVFDKIAYSPMALFLLVVAAVWFGCSNSAREIVSEQAIYRRERMVNLKIPSYVMSKFAVLGFICAIQCAVLLLITDVVLGFDAVWGWQYFFLVVCSFAGVGMGLLLSSLVRTNEAAIALVPLLLIPQVILGGLILPVDDMKHDTMKVMTVPMVARWGFEGMLHAETYQDAFRISDIKVELKEQEIYDGLKDKRCIREFEYEEPEKPIKKYFSNHKDTYSEMGDVGVLLGFNFLLLFGVLLVLKIKDPEVG